MTVALLLILGLILSGAGGYRYWRFLSPDRPSADELAVNIQAPDWDPSPAVTTSSPTPTATRPATTTRPRVPGWPRIRIPAIDVDAPISRKGVDPDGSMQNPNGPEDVAWYDFSARPGSGGNVVMSGHLDFYNYGDAVFARLGQLRVGDTIEITLQNGSRYMYRVVSSRSYRASNVPLNELLAATPTETLTLITCDGEWNSRAREYTDRLIVRAQLVQTLRGDQ